MELNNHSFIQSTSTNITNESSISNQLEDLKPNNYTKKYNLIHLRDTLADITNMPKHNNNNNFGLKRNTPKFGRATKINLLKLEKTIQNIDENAQETQSITIPQSLTYTTEITTIESTPTKRNESARNCQDNNNNNNEKSTITDFDRILDASIASGYQPYNISLSPKNGNRYDYNIDSISSNKKRINSKHPTISKKSPLYIKFSLDHNQINNISNNGQIQDQYTSDYSNSNFDISESSSIHDKLNHGSKLKKQPISTTNDDSFNRFDHEANTTNQPYMPSLCYTNNINNTNPNHEHQHHYSLEMNEPDLEACHDKANATTMTIGSNESLLKDQENNHINQNFTFYNKKSTAELLDNFNGSSNNQENLNMNNYTKKMPMYSQGQYGQNGQNGSIPLTRNHSIKNIGSLKPHMRITAAMENKENLFLPNNHDLPDLQHDIWNNKLMQETFSCDQQTNIIMTSELPSSSSRRSLELASSQDHNQPITTMTKGNMASIGTMDTIGGTITSTNEGLLMNCEQEKQNSGKFGDCNLDDCAMSILTPVDNCSTKVEMKSNGNLNSLNPNQSSIEQNPNTQKEKTLVNTEKGLTSTAKFLRKSNSDRKFVSLENNSINTELNHKTIDVEICSKNQKPPTSTKNPNTSRIIADANSSSGLASVEKIPIIKRKVGVRPHSLTRANYLYDQKRLATINNETKQGFINRQGISNLVSGTSNQDMQNQETASKSKESIAISNENHFKRQLINRSIDRQNTKSRVTPGQSSGSFRRERFRCVSSTNPVNNNNTTTGSGSHTMTNISGSNNTSTNQPMKILDFDSSSLSSSLNGGNNDDASLLSTLQPKAVTTSNVNNSKGFCVNGNHECNANEVNKLRMEVRKLTAREKELRSKVTNLNNHLDEQNHKWSNKMENLMKKWRNILNSQKEHYENLLKKENDIIIDGIQYTSKNPNIKGTYNNDENQIILETQQFINEMALQKMAYKFETNASLCTMPNNETRKSNKPNVNQ